MILESIVNKSPIVKGWSGDQKYCAVTADGTFFGFRLLIDWNASAGNTRK